MKHLLIVCLFLFPSVLFGQKYFDRNKSHIKKELEHYIAQNSSLNPVLTVTDSSLVLTIAEPDGPTRFIYSFDGESGKCNAQRTEANCEACYKKYRDNLLQQKTQQWKKLNENQYVSRYEDRLLVELSAEENDFSFTVFKTKWTKDFYELLIKD